MDGMEYLGKADGTFDPVEYKQKCRIKSGVDTILRGVLPFMPTNEEMPA